MYQLSCYDPYLELPREGGSNEGPQPMFLRKINRNYLGIIIEYAPHLEQ